MGSPSECTLGCLPLYDSFMLLFTRSVAPGAPPTPVLKCLAHMGVLGRPGWAEETAAGLPAWSLPLIRRSLMTAGLASGGEALGG